MKALAGAAIDRPRVSLSSAVKRGLGKVYSVPGPLLPVRLAWRQLRAERARLIAAVAGVMFASVLVLMQFGFRSALFDSAIALPHAIRGQLFLLNPLTTALFRAEPVPRIRGYQALGDPEVIQAVSIYLAQEPWRNPVTGMKRAIQIIGFNPQAGAVAVPGLASVEGALTQQDTLAFDARSRPEFGNIVRLLAEHRELTVQIGNHVVKVIGTVRLGASFAADGNAVTSADNFFRLVPGSRSSDAALIALRVKRGANLAEVCDRLRKLLPRDVDIVTHSGLVRLERRYWDQETPIGVIFAFGTVMGLIIGMVIVYQILFTDVCSHLRGYATLMAVGFTHRYLQAVVLAEACILACLGFFPGLLLSAGLYRYVSSLTYLPLKLTSGHVVLVFLLGLVMCLFSGLIALRKLREVDPVSVF